MDKDLGDLCSAISSGTSLWGDLRQATSPLHSSVSHLQNGGSDTDCLHRALCKLLTQSTMHKSHAMATEILQL